MNKIVRIALMPTISILVAIAGLGCSELSSREKVLLAAMLGSQTADCVTTTRYIDIGGTETNPILDDRPHRDQVILFKGGVAALLYGLGEIFPDHREDFYWIGIVSGGGAAAYNQSLYERYRN